MKDGKEYPASTLHQTIVGRRMEDGKYQYNAKWTNKPVSSHLLKLLPDILHRVGFLVKEEVSIRVGNFDVRPSAPNPVGLLEVLCQFSNLHPILEEVIIRAFGMKAPIEFLETLPTMQVHIEGLTERVDVDFTGSSGAYNYI
uniref:Uncharacterized protein n=1 Tax=Amphimedon queenslandica TaxID=400682 RepID=A0A1X7U9M3_AMPQE